MVCRGLRGILGHRTVSAKIKKPQANQDKLAILSREERPVALERDRGASLNPDARQCPLPALSPLDHPHNLLVLFV